MPGKNTIKKLYEGGYYHVYNRGVAKQNIFCARNDYIVFLRFLKEYLLPIDHADRKELLGINPRRRSVTLFSEVELLSFCLMPNHFHLYVKNISKDGLTRFMKALSTNYAMYFNFQYKRVGPLFQGIYKAIEVRDPNYYTWITRYIHRNPYSIIARDQPLWSYEFSSYPAYLGLWKADWLNTGDISEMFSSKNPRSSYQNFVEDSLDMVAELEPLLLGLDD